MGLSAVLNRDALIHGQSLVNLETHFSAYLATQVYLWADLGGFRVLFHRLVIFNFILQCVYRY